MLSILLFTKNNETMNGVSTNEGEALYLYLSSPKTDGQDTITSTDEIKVYLPSNL